MNEPPLLLLAQTVYPFDCRDCGATVTCEEERYQSHRRCRPCGLAAKRQSMARTTARARGETIPKQPFGPAPSTYPFPCRVCDRTIASFEERYGASLSCVECGRETRLRKRLRDSYGITLEEWLALRAASDGRCASCGEPPDAHGLVLDHDHETGALRGLICRACNWTLGYAGESPARMRAAADYLERHQ